MFSAAASSAIVAWAFLSYIHSGGERGQSPLPSRYDVRTNLVAPAHGSSWPSPLPCVPGDRQEVGAPGLQNRRSQAFEGYCPNEQLSKTSESAPRLANHSGRSLEVGEIVAHDPSSDVCERKSLFKSHV